MKLLLSVYVFIVKNVHGILIRRKVHTDASSSVLPTLWAEQYVYTLLLWKYIFLYTLLYICLYLLWIKALGKYWPWFKNVSALETMELSAGLTCQQKSVGSRVKPGEEITAAAPMPSLLPACLSQTTSFGQPRLPCLAAASPQLPLTRTSRLASHSSMLKGQMAFWNPVL